ncbi:MAG: magnesium-protoporphyrin IX monomethyl ester (oxidative) cyclase, partial [Pseudomonadota bacterium]
VRDHARPAFHKALEVDIEDYDMRVFEITSEISKQCFPITLDLEHERFLPLLRILNRINVKIAEADRQGGVFGTLKKVAYMGAAGFNFLRLYMIPTKKNMLPAKSRLEPVW